MKYFLSIVIFLLIGSSSVLAFQSGPVPTLSSSSRFHQRQASFFRNNINVAEPTTATTPTASPLLSSVVVDSQVVTESVADVHDDFNPWERVCTTVQSTASQLNEVRQKIAKSGVATAISYSLVSNVFTSVAVSLAWYGFSMQTGLSPISPGQWKPFLAWYGGFYAVNSLLKPIRFMIALAVVPHTEKIMAGFQSHFDDSRRAAIICSTSLLFVISACLMTSAIVGASLVSGTPIFTPSAVAL